MREDSPIAVIISDLHLSLAIPAFRAEKDWLAVQARYLSQVKELSQGKVPVLCCGDVFDRWNPPPELLHFALCHLPKLFAVPGQHDLPNHRRDLMHKSGYGVLVEAGRIVDLSGRQRSFQFDEFTVWGFGWGQALSPFTEEMESPQIALAHRYVWTIGFSYPGAPEDSHLSALAPKLRGYDAAFFGDNHKGFDKQLKSGTAIMNVGGFIRRKSDEIDYRPAVGLLYKSGQVRRHFLDTGKDQFQPGVVKREEVAFDMKDFVDKLEGLGEHGLDFEEAVRNHLRSEDLPKRVKEIILSAIQT